MKKKSIIASEFEDKFENGEDLVPFLDLDEASIPGLKAKRINIDFPLWMVQELDRIAQKLGITRQSLIKVFISDKLKELH